MSMDKPLSPYDRLDVYLARMEEEEKARKKRMMVLLSVIGILLLGGGFFTYRYLYAQPASDEEMMAKLRRYAAEELNPEKVQQLFVQNPEPLVLIHPVTGVDTVNSMDDYYQFLNRLDLLDMETDVEETEARANLEEEQVEEKENKLPEFKVDVEGEKRVGEGLSYNIENFDPEYELILDFGNGITKRPRSATYTYTYPLPGHFDFHLKIVKDGEEKILQTIKYQIFPKEEQQAEEGLEEVSARTSV